MGAGVAIFDYDNDGWMDILFVDSGSSSFYTPKARSTPCCIAIATTALMRMCPCTRG